MALHLEEGKGEESRDDEEQVRNSRKQNPAKKKKDR